MALRRLLFVDRTIIAAALVAIVFTLLDAWTSPAALAQTQATTPAVRAQHGDWQIVCKKPTGARNEICAAVQDVTSESNPDVGLSVHFQQSLDGRKSLRVFTPLGVLLPRGLGLQIDQTQVGRAPFVRCHVIGCLAQVTLDDTLMGKFISGETAWFIVFQTKEAGIGIPVSLNGLSAAMKTLTR